MFNTSTMCRRQAAHHRQLAAASPLEKVRRIALTAAKAWEMQAMEAEAHEAGKPDMLSAEDAAIALEFRQEDEEEARASPDPSTTDSNSLQDPMKGAGI